MRGLATSLPAQMVGLVGCVRLCLEASHFCLELVQPNGSLGEHEPLLALDVESGADPFGEVSSTVVVGERAASCGDVHAARVAAWSSRDTEPRGPSVHSV